MQRHGGIWQSQPQVNVRLSHLQYSERHVKLSHPRSSSCVHHAVLLPVVVIWLAVRLARTSVSFCTALASRHRVLVVVRKGGLLIQLAVRLEVLLWLACGTQRA